METVQVNVQNYTCLDFHWDGFQTVHYMFIVSFASIKKSALEGGHIDIQCNLTHVVFSSFKKNGLLFICVYCSKMLK